MLNTRSLLLFAFAFCLISGSAMAQSGKGKLLLDVSNERFDLKFYGEPAFGLFKTTGSAKGPQLLQKSGELQELIVAVQPGIEVVDLSGDSRAYTIDLKFTVPQEEIAPEVINLILDKLGYTGQTEQMEREVMAISIADLEKAQQAKQEKLPANAKSYSTSSKGDMGFYGYPLSEVLDKLNEQWGETLFIFSAEQDEKVGLEISGKESLERWVSELQGQGLAIEPIIQHYEPLVIRK